jgi:hypothetical protein
VIDSEFATFETQFHFIIIGFHFKFIPTLHNGVKENKGEAQNGTKNKKL